MGEFFFRPHWRDTVQKQEELLVLDSFTREDAMDVGLSIVRLVRERYRGNAAVCILEDGMVVFAFKMPGTTLKNEWWMQRKHNVSCAMGVSSLLAYLQLQAGERAIPWPESRSGAYVACGGCFPIRLRDGQVQGHILVSGLPHEEDHQVIVDALSAHRGIPAPSICDT